MTKNNKKKGKSADSKDKNGNTQSGTVSDTPPTFIQQPQTKMAAPISGQSATLLSQARDVLVGDQSPTGAIGCQFQNSTQNTIRLQTHISKDNLSFEQNTLNSQNVLNAVQQPGYYGPPVYHTNIIQTQIPEDSQAP